MSEMTETIQPSTPQPTNVHEIYAHEAYRRYKIIDLKGSEIERTAQELVEASKLLNNRDLWVANFRATVNTVRAWCDDVRSKVRTALVDVRSNKVLFYFVPSSESYDLELGDKMTDLEISLSAGAGIGYVETLQVPERSLERFVDGRSLMVWSRPDAATRA
jgi:hypothetical protein